MSKIRQNVAVTEGELNTPPEGDLRAYVIFTQLKAGGPFIYAGWLDAPDDEMALILAREHYGQDQKCTAIWAMPREFVGGLRENVEAAQQPVSEPRQYQIFTQQNAGDQHISSIRVTATSAAEAIEQAKGEVEGARDMHNLWAVPVEEIVATAEGDLIWRHTDQSYRLARGYSKDVRRKWETIREERDLEQYEKDDLKETF